MPRSRHRLRSPGGRRSERHDGSRADHRIHRRRPHRQPGREARDRERLRRRAQQLTRARHAPRSRRRARTARPGRDGERRGRGRRSSSSCRSRSRTTAMFRSSRSRARSSSTRTTTTRNATGTSRPWTTAPRRARACSRQHLPGAHVVKTFNHIYAADLTTDGAPAGTPNRRALAIAGDDAAAKQAVTPPRPIRVRHRGRGAARRELAHRAGHTRLRTAPERERVRGEPGGRARCRRTA